MGTFPGGVRVPEPARVPASIHTFFSNNCWIEGAALEQLDHMARLPGALSIAAFPDLHPGKYGATGVALLADRLHPLLVGNDIGCGMSLFRLDLPARKLKLDRAASRLRRFDEIVIDDPSQRLEDADLPADLFADALGTIGGGNHFCELQAVENLVSDAVPSGIDRQMLYLLVHSGSRGLGADVFSTLLSSGADLAAGIDPQSPEGHDWLLRQDQCVVWASLNRRLIAEKAAFLLGADLEPVCDMPHNLVRQTAGGFVHYKGAAAVDAGALAPVAGSRATLSHIVRATGGVERSLGGISHGAGRKYDRATMHGRVGRTRSERDALLRNGWGGIAICDDRDLVIEEAASAYKDATQVVEDLRVAGLIEIVASMRPLLTYKKTAGAGDGSGHGGKPDHRRTGGRKHDRS